MPLIVRASEHRDIAAIAAIYAPAVLTGSASFELEPPDAGEMATRRQALVERGFPHLVAEKGGVVVGYAYAGPYRPRPAYRYTVEDSVYIAPDRHGQGVGTALLGELIRLCEAGGFRQMVAVIGDSASTGSIALHRSQGFEHAGTVRAVGFKHGRWLDQVLMQRPLGQGGETVPTA